MDIAHGVQRTGQQVLALVMLQLVTVGLVVQAGVDLLRQQYQSAHSVAMRGKLLRMGELIGMALEVVGP
ncbi:hypothetical protein D3C76_1775030 [compost metagenome]